MDIKTYIKERALRDIDEMHIASIKLRIDKYVVGLWRSTGILSDSLYDYLLESDLIEDDELFLDKDIRGYKTFVSKEEEKLTDELGPYENLYAHDDVANSPQESPMYSWGSNLDHVVVGGGTDKSLTRPISKSDWMPRDIVYHEDDFYDWIESINSGFRNKIYYEKFDLYVRQCNQWMDDPNHTRLSRMTHRELLDYYMNELTRISENSLYATNMYLYRSDDSEPGGIAKYYANDDYEHHRIQCYLIDCGYSIIEGKPRQVGDTTIKSGISIFKILTKSNLYIKIITENTATGEEIFDDKIKFAYSHLQSWIKPRDDGDGSRVLNDTDRLLRIGKKIKSGKDKGINSRIEVVAPSKTAINGGSPSIVLIDEADSIPILTEMLLEGRPTMYKRLPDGRLKQVRQVIIWSTGTTKNSNGAFEREFKRVMGLWKRKEFEVGIVPIFYDWTCRCDEDEYNRQKRYYYGLRASEEGIDNDVSIIQFHQHYPSNIEDMFVSSSRTLISRIKIQENINRINNSTLLRKRPLEHGYFIPVYDKGRKRGENSDHPYEIIDAEWVPCDITDDNYSTTIFRHPEKGWHDRYYMGTDPIASDTGTSYMSSTVWDEHYKTPCALLNFRIENDTKKVYTQAMLLGLYYDVRPIKRGIPELLERNIGANYKDYLDSYGYRNRLLFDAQLMDLFKSSVSSAIGLDNKGVRARNLISYMQQLFNTYDKHIFIGTYFHQLRTFVLKVTRSGNESWGVSDKKLYRDDTLFSLTFSKICADSIGKMPYKDEDTSKRLKSHSVLKMDSNGNLYREKTYR